MNVTADNIVTSTTAARGLSTTMPTDSSLLMWRRNVDDSDMVGKLSIFLVN